MKRRSGAGRTHLWRVAVAAAGLALAAWQWGGAAWLAGKAVAAQVLLERAWATGTEAPRPPPWPGADFAPVARLAVPALAVERIVLSDASPRTLAFGPGRLSESALPGTPGATVIAGHRDTHFRFLHELAPGMKLTVDDGVTNRAYRVVEIRVLDTRTERLSLDGPERLVLVTCWPFDALRAGGPLRYVAVAEPVSVTTL